MSIVKKTIHRSSIESPEVPIKETIIGSENNEAPDIPAGTRMSLMHIQGVHSVDFIP